MDDPPPRPTSSRVKPSTQPPPPTLPPHSSPTPSPTPSPTLSTTRQTAASSAPPPPTTAYSPAPPPPTTPPPSSNPFETFSSTVNALLSSQTDKYTTNIPLTVFAGTYNVNGKVAGDVHALVRWLETEISTGCGDPDVFAIGLQEVVDLSAGNVVMDSFLNNEKGVGTQVVEEWKMKLQAALDTICCTQEHDYELCCLSHMVGVVLYVFVKSSWKDKIGDVEAAIVPTGNMGLANKGGALLRLTICSTSFCFVSAHFAAHRSKVKKRNRDFHVISKRAVFEDTAVARYAEFNRKAERRMNPKALGTASSSLSVGGAETQAQHKRRQSAVMSQLPIAVGAKKMEKRGSDWWENADNVLFGNPSLPGKSIDTNTIPPPPPNPKLGLLPSSDKEAAMIRNKEKLKTLLDYDEEDDDIDEEPAVDEQDYDEQIPGKMSCLEHDIVIWVGDLNYRPDVSIDIKEVYELLNVVASDRASVGHEENVNEAINILVNKDQLVIERSAGRVFKGFEEGRLIFMPTYKYIPGDTTTDWYDDRPDKKMRVPAWCDRVLWRVNDNSTEKVKLLQYRRTDGIYISDHKPVNALLECTIKEIDEQKREEILLSVVKQSNEKVEEMHVTVKVHGAWEFETDGHDFEEISVVVLENLSKRTTANWSLEKAGVPPWMRVLGDSEGALPPGERVELRARLEPEADEWVDDENEHDIDNVHPGAIIKIGVARGNSAYVACMNKWLDRRQKERAAAAAGRQRTSSRATEGGGSMFAGKEGGYRDSLKKKLGMKKRGSA